MTKGYKPWKNYQEKPSSQGKDHQVKKATIDLKQEAPQTEVPEDTTKVVKLEKEKQVYDPMLTAFETTFVKHLGNISLLFQKGS